MLLGYNVMTVEARVVPDAGALGLEGTYKIGNTELPVCIFPKSYECLWLAREKRPGKRGSVSSYKHWQNLLRSLEREFGLGMGFRLHLSHVDIELSTNHLSQNVINVRTGLLFDVLYT